MALDLLEEIERLEKKIDRTQSRLRGLTAGDERVAALLAEPGIGEVTACPRRR